MKFSFRLMSSDLFSPFVFGVKVLVENTLLFFDELGVMAIYAIEEKGGEGRKRWRLTGMHMEKGYAIGLN